MDVWKNPWWILAIGVSVSLVAVSVTAVFRWRPPQWERLYYDLADLIARQLKTFEAMTAIIERGDPTPAQRAAPALSQQQVDERLGQIILARPRQRTTADFLFVLAHFTAAWYLTATESGLVTGEHVNLFMQSNLLPPDLAEHLRQQLELAMVVHPFPDDLSEVMTTTGYQRALTGS